MQCTTTCSEHQQFARAVFIFRLVFLAKPACPAPKAKASLQPDSLPQVHYGNLQVTACLETLHSLPLSQCWRGLFLQSLLCVSFKFRCRHPGPGISALGFFARHLQSALLWVLESLLLYKGGSHQKGKAQRFAAATGKKKKINTIPKKIKANSKENWQSLIGRNFLQYLFP